VTVPNALQIIADLTQLQDTGKALEKLAPTRPDLAPLLRYFHEMVKQPPEQLGGIRSTVFNYLQPFTAPDIAEVFCPEKPTFSLSEIDQGKLISVKIPQKYQVEKKYVGLLLKVLFYLHALRRYDLSYEERGKKNLIVMVLDEAQETVLVSEDGISDYNVIDKIRGARATTINSTQSPTSYIPPMGGRDKADVFLLNLGNKIYFTAADKQSSEMIADSIGKHTIKKRTYGRAAGKNTMSWKEEDEHWIKPHELRALPKHRAIIKHCERDFRRAHLKPTAFTLPRPLEKRPE
jgi:type IV secretory pathway TraG/TraD family ATPase VirD4